MAWVVVTTSESHAMTDKSYVSLEQRQCLVCGKLFDTGNILLDKRLRASMNQHTTTGAGLCAEDQQRYNEGYIALVECDPKRSGFPQKSLNQRDAYRTGKIAHLRRTAFAELFGKLAAPHTPLVFVEPGVIDRLMEMSAEQPPEDE